MYISNFIKQNKRILLSFTFLLAAFLSFSFVKAHKFYVSVTQIEFREDQHSLQIVSRFFIDDMETYINKLFNVSIKINEELKSNENNFNINTYIENSLEENITFVINGSPKKITYLGSECKDDLILCYYEIENIESLEKIEISNQMFCDIFDEQQNIVHVKNMNDRKSIIFTKDEGFKKLKFSE